MTKVDLGCVALDRFPPLSNYCLLVHFAYWGWVAELCGPAWTYYSSNYFNIRSKLVITLHCESCWTVIFTCTSVCRVNILLCLHSKQRQTVLAQWVCQGEECPENHLLRKYSLIQSRRSLILTYLKIYHLTLYLLSGANPSELFLIDPLSYITLW